jgi:hypothetical protein
MAERPKIHVKTSAPPRDPRRPPVRGMSAPRPAPEQRRPPDQGRPPDAGPPRAEMRPNPPERQPRQPRPERPARPMPPPRTPPPMRPAPRPPAPRAAPAPSPASTATTASGVRVSKLMSELGLASRREADEWIERGWVKVDGVVAILGQKRAAAPEDRPSTSSAQSRAGAPRHSAAEQAHRLRQRPGRRRLPARLGAGYPRKPLVGRHLDRRHPDGDAAAGPAAAWHRPDASTSIPPACWC